MKKRALSILLIASMLITLFVPMQIVAAEGNSATAAVDTSWYNSGAASGTVFEIADAADLRGAARLSQQGVTFSGYTLKLTANIDLNPGWNAEVKVENGKATLPDAPTVEFEGFATFAGTLDGNGKTVSGIYMAQRLLASSANLGFIEILTGTVKNLIINNSFIFAEIADGCNDCKIGGIAARANNEAALIDTVYADIDVWYRAWSYQRLGGIVGKTGAKVTIQNVAFVGQVGCMEPGTNAAPGERDTTWISQLLGHADWKHNTLVNCSLKGTEYVNGTPGQYDSDAGSSAVHTNVLIGADVALPTTVAAMNPGAYSNSLAAFNLWPSATADGKTASYEDGKQAYVKYYSTATEDNYTNYLSTLESNGYTKDAEYTVGNNLYALYQKAGAYSVFVSYLGKVNNVGYARMRVFVEPFGASYNVNAAATEASVCSAQIWQLDVDNSYGNENGGMSYVIRLTDGTFIVIDGGYRSEAEAKNLYQILNYNNPNGGKPVIRAWFITHLHNDHFGGLTRFAEKYSSSVTVEGFYYNFPGQNPDTEENADKIDMNNLKTVEMAMNMFDGAVKYRKIHSGMTFGFAGVTATVLGTHEDVKQSYWKKGTIITTNEANDMKDGNDTSAVIKFTVGDQTFMVLGDARMGMSRQLQYSYSAGVLKSDIVQVAHHGYTGVQDELYEIIDASVALWPMDVLDYSNDDNGTYDHLFKYYLTNTGDLDIAANDYIRNNADEIIPSYENVCLTMPYTAKTYSGGSQYVDLAEAYNTKIYNINVDTTTADTSWYAANATTYYLYNVGDVLGFASLAAGGNNFAGKTIMLMADIDFNPGWSADVTEDGTVVFPAAPSVVWPEIASFAGTFDGNGYTLSGLYKSMTVSGNTGAYGGLFNTIAGGTVKNIRFSNSFILATNTAWGSGNIHVGGVAGDVNAGTLIQNIYMDETVEVWYKSDGHCNLGGAYAFANGKATLTGFVFVGTIGNTSLANAVNYACPSDKAIVIATVVACTNSKSCVTTNCLGLKTSIHSGKTYNSNNDRMGLWDTTSTSTCIANTRESAAWLLTRPTDYGANFTWSDALQAICPNISLDLVNGTYDHARVDNTSSYTNDENTYMVYTAEELLNVIKNGGNFAGKTIMLMADIDLNPGWSANVTENGTVVFPTAPSVAWPNIASFAGTLDGNGYTLSGLYKTMTVSGSAGAYGGLFNTLAGGTVKNLTISNSFVLATNTGAGDGKIHVGGISGDIAAGSNVYNVVMDDTVEVWFKSDSHACVGGAFGYSTGSFTLKGFVFVGVVGNTSSANAVNYSCSGTFYIATILAATGGNKSTMLHATGLAESIHTGKKNNTWGAVIGTWQDGMTASLLASTRESAEWLVNTRPTDYGVSHYWSDTLNSILPKEVKDMVEGTYSHVVNYAKDMDTPEILYQVSDVIDGKYNIRFVSGVNKIDTANKIGYSIELIVDGESYVIDPSYTLTDTVYESIIGDGEIIRAEDVGYDYLYTREITGVPATENVKINISALTIDLDGNTIQGKTMTFSFIYGTGCVVSR